MPDCALACRARCPRHAGSSESERGVAIVEIAIVLPVVMCLVLGMFSGGIAYNRKISMVTAAREGSRYGATLPVSNFPTGLNGWLASVADAVEKNATNDIDVHGGTGTICVAYVHPSGTAADDRTTKLVRTTAGDTVTTGSDCFADGRPDPDEPRVQVSTGRTTRLEAVFFARNLQLSANALTHFEAS